MDDVWKRCSLHNLLRFLYIFIIVNLLSTFYSPKGSYLFAEFGTIDIGAAACDVFLIGVATLLAFTDPKTYEFLVVDFAPWSRSMRPPWSNRGLPSWISSGLAQCLLSGFCDGWEDVIRGKIVPSTFLANTIILDCIGIVPFSCGGWDTQTNLECLCDNQLFFTAVSIIILIRSTHQ